MVGGDGYGKATGSLVELEHGITNYLLGGEPMATYQISISEEQLHGLFEGDRGMASLLEAILNQVLQAQATEQLGGSHIRELKNGPDIAMG